ncbi:cysteine hydrolase family protein [uncultured Sphingomonas sp.]|uniref:cysteine hydrolase family protein n=1 Tax=uncultured Sphingomonas sp. TaxID=158754 RepID=UPI0035CB056D
MSPTNATLLVIDVQQGFLDASWGPRNNPGAEANIARLIAAWRRDGRPVRHVRHSSRSPVGAFFRGTIGHEPKAGAAPAFGEPVHLKEVNSGFIGTSLEQDLRAAGVDTLVVVGLTTNYCVSTTVRMAGNLGFTVDLVEDATATFDRKGLDGKMRLAAEVHAAALSDLSEEFASIVGTDDVLRVLEAREPLVICNDGRSDVRLYAAACNDDCAELR